MDIRAVEKSKKWGYMFYISYNGAKFQSFDEMNEKKSIKGKFREVMEKIGFTWAKGVQQAGRTDAKVSANENILYVSSNFNGNIKKIQEDFNKNSDTDLKVTMIKKTFPNIVFPDMIEKREYIYSYPEKLIKNTEEEIEKLCKELSGTYDVSEFTDKKGLELKEHIREVKITYENGKLRFLGNSFMPKQVRIMSGYILTGKKEPLMGKYLTLEKVYLKNEMKNIVLQEIPDIEEENVIKIEKTADGSLYIFYVPQGKRGEFIGKNGKNIKEMKKKYGDIVVREI
ncbi:pseudouridylate synthase [Fusobacterium ulcerans]|uniref:tRNA pseudouridine synthase A n=1 Tax=Fusobacterium ulcerans TaxID=861 RepID=A0AAX2J6C7_9FUSO|nr:pseudouridylate synthase [Fusobacterium ulcerans]AVQ27959.1 pseudouridylate synthase [Fusobacterium ulcerans]EFS25416.1 tRNA pseudouridine synthase A [Fusobacterium ulcerans ATCC 49185]SQI99378.1 tRNA pseudouridine synthase A [Fusobacterium ulcerans]